MDDVLDDPQFLLTIMEWCELVLLWRQANRRRYWVRPINENRPTYGDFTTLFQELKDDTVMFFRYTRMTVDTFYILLDMLSPKLQKTNWRALKPEQRLAITLRYLASGDQTLSIALAYRVGESTTYSVIRETTKIITDVLLPIYLKPPTEEDYKSISNGFLEQWNFPNCIGSFDGRHCIIQAPPRSGSLYFNYKKTFSVVLMAACDHNYKFILVDVGSYGSHNDASIFSESEIGIALKTGKLKVPKRKMKLPGSNESSTFFFIGDEGFPLSKNFMRPFSGRNLDDRKRIFNYRLSRARRTIENAFGILVSRWRVLRRPICVHPETADKIIMSCVCLHNFLKNRDEQLPAVNRIYCPSNFIDSENDHGEIIQGAWRNNDSHIQCALPINVRRATIEAYEQRDLLSNYFLTEQGEIPWQLEYIRRGNNRDEN